MADSIRYPSLHTLIDEKGPFTLTISGAEEPMCYGYVDNDVMHEFVCKQDGEIIRERHTPFHIWNRGGAAEFHNG